jgi:3-phosphoglycerate kinase
MEKAFIGYVDPKHLFHKHVLVHVDYNVPLRVDKDKVEVVSDVRIIDSLQTIRFLLSAEANIVLCSHLGTAANPNLTLRPVVESLQQLLPELKIELLPDCIGEEIQNKIRDQQPNSILVLENLFLYPEEEMNSERFALELVKGINIYVNDSFAISHKGTTKNIHNYLFLQSFIRVCFHLCD